jgi:hypothetical protein
MSSHDSVLSSLAKKINTLGRKTTPMLRQDRDWVKSNRQLFVRGKGYNTGRLDLGAFCFNGV